MKRNFSKLCPLVCMCLLQGIGAMAQQTMLMGNVTDGSGNPIKGAAICVKNRNYKAVALSDISGLFASDLLPHGQYKVTIISGGNEMKAGSISLEANATPQKYYHFTVEEKSKAMVVATTDNPFMEAKLGNIAKSDMWFDAPRRSGSYDLYNPNLWRVYFLDTKDSTKVHLVPNDVKSNK